MLSHEFAIQRLEIGTGTNNLIQDDPKTGRCNFTAGLTGDNGLKFGAHPDAGGSEWSAARPLPLPELRRRGRGYLGHHPARQGWRRHLPLSSSQLSPQIICATEDNTIPVGVGAVILVFVQAPKAADAAADANSWRIMVIEDSPKIFPDGGAFIANLDANDIRFVVGEHKGMLHAAGSHGYAMPAERDSFNRTPVIFEFAQNDKWHIANESALRFLPGMRYLIFAYVDQASGRARISTYQDFGPPTVPAAGAKASN